MSAQRDPSVIALYVFLNELKSDFSVTRGTVHAAVLVPAADEASRTLKSGSGL